MLNQEGPVSSERDLRVCWEEKKQNWNIVKEDGAKKE
jgi:hypothetical protein